MFYYAILQCLPCIQTSNESVIMPLTISRDNWWGHMNRVLYLDVVVEYLNINEEHENWPIGVRTTYDRSRTVQDEFCCRCLIFEYFSIQEPITVE